MNDKFRDRIKRFVTNKGETSSVPEQSSGPRTTALRNAARAAGPKGVELSRALDSIVTSAQSGATERVKGNLFASLDAALSTINMRSLTPVEREELWAEHHVDMHN